MGSLYAILLVSASAEKDGGRDVFHRGRKLPRIFEHGCPSGVLLALPNCSSMLLEIL